MTSLIGAVVVNHRSYDTVGQVVHDLLSEDLVVSDIVVVDNSEEDGSSARLRAVLPPDTDLMFVLNRGYGAAVNAGVQRLQASKEYDYIVVATHEVRITPGAIEALALTLDSDSTIGAAGPTLLIERNGHDEVWSTGGALTRWAGVPRHHDHRADPRVVLARNEPPAVPRRWLDGAFVMYRTEVLSEFRVNEIFFMYVEEVELHLRLGLAGLAIVWVPQAHVHQDSRGTPLYYFGRNLVLLHRLNGQRLRLALIPIVALRAALPQSIRRRSARPTRDVVRGILRGFTEPLSR